MDPVTASMVAGGVGSLVDAGLGIYTGYEERKRQRKARNELLSGMDKAEGIYQGAFDDVNPMYDPYREQGLDAWKQMAGMQGELDPNKYKMPEMGEFEFDESVDRYLDPSMAYQQEQAMKQLQGSASAKGGLMSGKTLKAIQDRGQNLAMQDYGAAFQRMQGDKQFAYQDYLNRFNSARDNINDRYSKFQDKYGRLEGQSSVGQWATGNQADLRSSLGDVQSQLAMGRAQAKANYHTNAPTGGEIWAGGIGTLARGAAPLAGAAMGGAFASAPDIQKQGIPTQNIGAWSPQTPPPSQPLQGWGNTPSHSWGS